MEHMKQSISVTIDKELIEWIKQQVATKKYRNKSHLVELALYEYKAKQSKQ